MSSGAITDIFTSVVYVCGTTLALQASGIPAVQEVDKRWATESLVFLQGLLDEFGEVWPAAKQTADSLRALQSESVPVELDIDYGMMFTAGAGGPS